MTKDELLKQMYDSTLVGNAPEVVELTNSGLAMGLNEDADAVRGSRSSLEEVGAASSVATCSCPRCSSQNAMAHWRCSGRFWLRQGWSRLGHSSWALLKVTCTTSGRIS